MLIRIFSWKKQETQLAPFLTPGVFRLTHLYEITFLVTRRVVIEASVSAAPAFKIAEEIGRDIREREFVLERRSIGCIARLV